MKCTQQGSVSAPWVLASWFTPLRPAFVAALLAGCVSDGLDPYFTSVRSKANVFVAPQPVAITKIAVLPFKAPTELIGSATSDMLVTEFLRMGRYTLVERGQMASVLGETELALAGLSETRAVEVAKMFGAQAVVLGTVDEYATQADRGRTFAVVGLSARMIDCRSGQVLWSADLAKMASNSGTPLSAHARAVVHELAAGLYVRISRAHPSHGSTRGARRMDGPVPPPSTPANVAVSDLGLREAILTWAPPPDAGCDVRVERSAAPAGPFVRVGTVSARRGRFADSRGLKDAATYYYRLVAVGQGGMESAPSPVVEAMTAPPPDAPPGLCATAPCARAVRLSWKAPRSEGITRYRVERAEAQRPAAWTFLKEVAGTEFSEGGRRGTDLLDSTDYLYRVAAVNRVGAVGTPSSPVTVRTLPPPAPVAGLTAGSGAVRCVPLAWKPHAEDDVQGYEIQRAAGKSAPFEAIGKVRGRESTRFLDGRRDPGDLPDAALFRYRVRAINAVGAEGTWSDPVDAVTRDVPPLMEGVAATGSLPRWVKVTWRASSDTKVVGYEVERAEGQAGAFGPAGTVDGLSTTTFEDRGGAPRGAAVGRLKDGTLYRYRVRAVNTAKAASPWSTPALAVTKAPPLPPLDVVASDDLPNSVEVRWEPNAEPDVTAYVVESRATDGTAWRKVARATAPPAREGGLDPGEERVYRAKAVDADTLESGWSATAQGHARPLPPPPTNLSTRWSGAGMDLAWVPASDSARLYRVWRHGLLSKDCLAEVAAPSATLPAEALGSRATLSVTALDEAMLESPESVRIEVRVPVSAPP